MEAILAASLDLSRLRHQAGTFPEASEVSPLGEQRGRQSSDDMGSLTRLEHELDGSANWSQPCSPRSSGSKIAGHSHVQACTLEGPVTLLLRTQSPDSAFSSDGSAASSPTPPLPTHANGRSPGLGIPARRMADRNLQEASFGASKGSLHAHKSASSQSEPLLEPSRQRRVLSTSNLKGSTSGPLESGRRSRDQSPAHNDIIPAQHGMVPFRLRLDEGSPSGSPRSQRMPRASRLSFDLPQGGAWDRSSGHIPVQRLQSQQRELKLSPAKAPADSLAKTVGCNAPRLAPASRDGPDSAARRGQGTGCSAASEHGKTPSLNNDVSAGAIRPAPSQLRHSFGSENELSHLSAYPRQVDAGLGCQRVSDLNTMSPARGFLPAGLPRSPQASPRRTKPAAVAQPSPLSAAAKEMGMLLPSDLKGLRRTTGTPALESPKESQHSSPGRARGSEHSRHLRWGLRGSSAGSLLKGFESPKRRVALSGNSAERCQQETDPWARGPNDEECIVRVDGGHSKQKGHELSHEQGEAWEVGPEQELGKEEAKAVGPDVKHKGHGIQLALHGARLDQAPVDTQVLVSVELGGSQGYRHGAGGVEKGEGEVQTSGAHAARQAESSSYAASLPVGRRLHRRNASVEFQQCGGSLHEVRARPAPRALAVAAGLMDAPIGASSSGVPERGPLRLIAHGRRDSESSMMSDLAIEHQNSARQRDRGAVESVAGYSIARGQDLRLLLQPGQVGKSSLGQNDSGMAPAPKGKVHSVAGIGGRQKSPLSIGSGEFDLGAGAAAAKALENKKAHRSRMSMDGLAQGVMRHPLRGLRIKDFVLGQPYEDVRKHFVMHRMSLGSGQFGIIRKCKEVTTGAIYACKTIAKKSIQCAEDAEDIRKEVGCLTMLRQHPTIVTVRQTFEDAENIHIVMDLCRGGDLLDRITAKGHLEEEDAAKLCLSLIEALLHCHCMGIVHRDIKPENILLTKPDSDSDIKLVDFGVATFVEGGQALTEVIGTPEYMAPEVIRKSYGPSADIWSAGVVMFIALCGLPPFWASSRQSIAESILNKQVSFKSAKWAKVSGECKDLIGRMLLKDPDQRSSATEILTHPWILRLSKP